MKLDWKYIKESIWYHQRTDALPCFVFSPVYGVMKLLKSKGVVICHFGKGFLENFFTEEFFYNEASKVIKCHRLNPGLFKRQYQNWLKKADILEKMAERKTTKDFKYLTNKELIKNYQDIDKTFLRVWSMPIFLDIFDTNLPEFIDKALTKSIKPTDSEMAILTSPKQLLKLQEYKLALGKTLKNKMTSQQVIKKFNFLHYGYFGGKELDEKILFKDLNNYKKDKKWLKEYLEFNNYKTRIKKQKEKIIKKYKLSPEIVNFLELVSILVVWRDQRKSFTQKIIRAIDILGKEIAQRSDINWSELCLCHPFRIDSIPVKKIILNKYAELNKDNYLFYFDGSRFVIVKGKKYDRLLSYITAQKQENKLKGQIACPGNITGRVKIIHGVWDFKNFQTGDILVTSMTRPEFMPIIHKAKAIITDEGGITCHAAIISRELNIPCIIGTKIATKILKSGDLVEINDQEKIVKIIKRK